MADHSLKIKFTKIKIKIHYSIVLVFLRTKMEKKEKKTILVLKTTEKLMININKTVFYVLIMLNIVSSLNRTKTEQSF